MRVLVAAAPMVGHVLPLLPLATAFRDAGHEVLVATAAEGAAAVRRAGLPVRDVAPGVQLRPLMTGALLRHPVRIGRMIRGDEGTDGVGLLFATIAERLAPGTVALADTWHPDLVLHEGLAPLGALVASRRGVPAVLVDALIFDGRRLFAAVTEHLAALTHTYGGGPLTAPADGIVTVPPSLVGQRPGRRMRHVPVGGVGEVPERLTRSGSRPRILVTRSTVDDPRRDLMMSRVVEAAKGADLDVVLVRPDPWVLRRPLPDNVTTTDWLPFPQVLPHVAGIVHHGGAGTVLTALAAGVPQLVVPGAGDRTAHARLVAARGAGLGVPLAELSTESLMRLVGEPGLRSAAGEVAAEIAGMPHPEAVVEELVARRP
jgi:UDP:flavonoid glycosyltransferase YjiC (YdhE family)